MSEILYRHVSGLGRVPIPEDEAALIRAEDAAEEEKQRSAPPPGPTMEERVAALEADVIELKAKTP